MSSSEAVPVWVWLPGTTEPVRAAELAPQGDARFGFAYLPSYTEGPGPVPLDPVSLRLKKGQVLGGLPGVIMDAKPAGYGQDRLNALWNPKYKRELTELELMEEGPGDTVGAIEACFGIERKIRWKASPVEALCTEIEKLEADAPPSRAMRRANGDVGTSAGGERPKATFQAQGRLWLRATMACCFRMGSGACHPRSISPLRGESLMVIRKPCLPWPWPRGRMAARASSLPGSSLPPRNSACTRKKLAHTCLKPARWWPSIGSHCCGWHWRPSNTISSRAMLIRWWKAHASRSR